MMIRVMYSDWRQDLVTPAALDRLLALKRVKKFKRFSGWVHVGHDRIRGAGGGRYGGADRRVASPGASRAASHQ
ncbi:GSU3473 family protein [Trichloromonas sp.]|uniref:GSU3473 family protein n=1 Tax=Trichloromonas sp. TaxID=3069249 RepID=UPI003D8132C6